MATKLTAKFRSQCIVCAKLINRGEAIEYEKGKGSWHAGCSGKKPEALASRRPDQMISGDADLAALAGQHGRKLAEDPARLVSLMVSDGTYSVGDIVLRKRGRLLVLAISPSRYYSADFLEDMDMFDLRPGRYCDVQCVAVLPTEAETAAENAAAARKARAAEVEATLRHSYGADSVLGFQAPAGIEMTKIYGDARMSGSETWYCGSDGAVYYCRSDYDMGPTWWRTTATPELIAEAKSLGVRP